MRLATISLALLTAHLIQMPLIAADQPQIQSKNTRMLPPPITNPEREARIYSELAVLTEIECSDLPVAAAMNHFSAICSLRIRIDEAALADAKISPDSSATLSVANVPLRRILNRLLIPLDLDWYVKGSEILVTTQIATGKRLNDSLKYEFQIIDALCELTEAQLDKLQFIGRRDIQRLLSAIEDYKTKIRLVGDDEEKAAKLSLEIEQLHLGIESGPFTKDSLFLKSLEILLTPAQMAKYKPIREVLQSGGRVTTVQRGPDVLLSVQLRPESIADDDLSRLKKVTMLGSLTLTLTKVTDGGLVHLQELTNLRELNLFVTQITDTGLVHLRGLTSLQTLGIGYTQVTDAGLASVTDLTNLQSLNLNYLKITDTSLAHLRKLTNLKYVDLAYTPVTDAGLVHLKSLTKLERLNLSGTKVTEAGLIHLKGLVNLQQLDLGGTQVTDDCVIQIKEMTALRSLNLLGSKVTDLGITNLLQALPNLRLGN